MKVLQPFLIALQFLTVLPVRLKAEADGRDTGRSVLYYPLVGLLMGLLIAGVDSALQRTPDLLRAALILFFWVTISGFLHLDGLADSADAWIGGRGDRDRTLAIMEDSCCGPAGVVMLVAVLLIKFAALAEPGAANPVIALIFAPFMGRTVLVLLFLLTPYVRPGGLGSKLAAHLPRRAASVMLLLIGLSITWVAGITGVKLMIAVTLVFCILQQTMIKRIGGTTGDTAGALVELTEAVTLALFLTS